MKLERMVSSLRREADSVMDMGAPDLDLILVPGVAFDADCNRVSGDRGH